ncbi:MAG: DUF1559 domain-containing protein, partial [Pseudomonadota bacterium]
MSGVAGSAGPNTFIEDSPVLRNPDLVNRSIPDDLIGVFRRRSETRLAQVTDGTSQTFMFGEAIGAVGQNITHTFPNFPNGPENGFVQGFVWAGWGCLPTFNGLDSSVEDGAPDPLARY